MARTTVPINLRVPPALRDRLDEAAQAGGRNLTQEVIARLETSFDVGLPPPSAGPDAAIGATIAEAMEGAGRQAAYRAGAEPSTWIDNPYAYDQAVRAAAMITEILRPTGKVMVPSPPKRFPAAYIEEVGADWACVLMTETNQGKPFNETPEAVRRTEWLGKTIGDLYQRRDRSNAEDGTGERS